MYPAYTQSNLQNQLKEPDPLEKEDYKEENLIQLSNYKNYIYQSQTSKFWKKANFEGFVLPSQGIAKNYCMKWVSWGCDNTKFHPKNEHYAEHEVKTCKTAFCPKCHESWINRQANRSTKRFSKFAENKQYYFRHIVLSPPQEEAKLMSYKELKKYLDFALKKANIKTCAIVFHPFRFQDQAKSMPYYSPHFHLLVYGYITDTMEFNNKTRNKNGNSWLIKNKGDMKTEIDIFNCVRYLLSHAGVRKKTHVIRYMGDISYRKLKVEKEPMNHVCPYCDLPLTIFFIKNSTKSKPPPIDYVGLWEPDCFVPFNPMQNDGHIPFYQLNEDPESDTDYSQELIYSFEDLLSVSTNLPIISRRKSEMDRFYFETSINCQKLDDIIP